jgi:hypothetical protein
MAHKTYNYLVYIFTDSNDRIGAVTSSNFLNFSDINHVSWFVRELQKEFDFLIAPSTLCAYCFEDSHWTEIILEIEKGIK